jgi:hypothetical protein
MKRFCIDFAPKVRVGNGIPKLVSVAIILLVIAGMVYWQLKSQVDVVGPTLVNTPSYLAPEEIQAADAAIRSLNTPWLEVFDVLDAIFEQPTDGALLSVEANVERMTFKVSGEARDPGFAQGIPSRLKTLKSVADAILIGQDQQGNSSRPVLFTLEFRMRDPS